VRPLLLNDYGAGYTKLEMSFECKEIVSQKWADFGHSGLILASDHVRAQNELT